MQLSIFINACVKNQKDLQGNVFSLLVVSWWFLVLSECVHFYSVQILYTQVIYYLNDYMLVTNIILK